MSKTINSPVKRFPGHVILSDPLTYPQAIAFEDSLNAIRETGADMSEAKAYYLILPGVCACVEEWHLDGIAENITPETFPSTPKKASVEIISWLVGEITALYQDAESVPNG